MNAALALLASFRLRLLFRGAFVLLMLAVLALAITVLQEEKQRSVNNYRASFEKTREQIVARLHQPSGQLALLNPQRDAAAAARGSPVVLPYSAIDFDDQTKVRNAVEMAGCLVPYAGGGSLCIGIGNNPWGGGFIYAAGSFVSGPLEAHRIGDEFLDGAHRLRVSAKVRGQTNRWLAPFEPLPPNGKSEGVRGRFTGYAEIEGRDYTGARPVKEFRGWVWQNSQCVDPAQEGNDACPRLSFFSLRLPIDVLRDALFQRNKLVWPPADLDRFEVRIQILPPGDGEALFDSAQPNPTPPFTLNDLGKLLLPGEALNIAKDNGPPVLELTGRDNSPEPSSPLLTRLIRRLPVESPDAPKVELPGTITTPLGTYTLLLKGDARSVNRTLAATATRLSWFVGAMLGAIAFTWLLIEIGLIRRIAALTRRTRGLSATVQGEGGLERYNLADLRGKDELGLLATALNDLLRRVREDAERERLRAEQEKDQWHAVGHEIMSPLQSLLALHGDPADPSHRYIIRMQQAVRILYGSASPSEAFQSSTVQVQAVDIAAFIRHVAENSGFDNVVCQGGDRPVLVRADEYPLEDVFAHLLKNADRYRPPGTPITLTLSADESIATVSIHNAGPAIPEELLDKIFEYGVSDQPDAGAHGNRGQGLFVAKTYMAKMGGTVAVRNGADGVVFTLGLLRAET